MSSGTGRSAIYGAIQYAVSYGHKAVDILRDAGHCRTWQAVVRPLPLIADIRDLDLSNFSNYTSDPALSLDPALTALDDLNGTVSVSSDVLKRCLLDRQDTGNAAKAVGETVQFFITTMDSLKLNMVAVDQLYPLLNDLMQSLNKVRLHC